MSSMTTTSGVAVYDESLIAPLEAQVGELSKGEAGSLPVEQWLYLLRLYRLYPARASLQCVVRILLSLLTEQASSGCEHLIPSSMFNAPEIRQTLEISNAIHVSHFDAMWALVDQYQVLIKEYCPNFASRIRVTIANTISKAFLNLTTEAASRLLKESDLDALEKLHPEFRVDKEAGVLITGASASSAGFRKDYVGSSQKITYDMIKKLDETQRS